MLLLETQWIEPVLIMLSFNHDDGVARRQPLYFRKHLVDNYDGDEDGYNGGGGGNKDCIDDDIYIMMQCVFVCNEK